MINETFDRIIGWWAPVAPAVRAEVGTYSACYKLSIHYTLCSGFPSGVDPSFKQASGESHNVYIKVMKFFVITIWFLFVSLYLDIWKHFIKNEHMWVGLKVVPILLLANMFLGIYYNLSVWYKVTNRTMAGAYITLIGAAITLLINYLFIPKYSYMACAWATFFCYGSMMLISFIWGQKEYRVPYAWKKLSAYILIVVLIYFVHTFLAMLFPGKWISIIFFDYCSRFLFSLYS